ncbi:MAG TPA: 2,3-bisphosphoglycerate-dependent phosphoglycerate mutase [Candidatus Paceibacterota bacterium]|nr:2,3-bisphosphoglycerate-dependent phosphoglycerate mutase [Candidatus Paceibacterota bacterium]
METKNVGKLVLLRHTESEWNKLGKWTGVVDVHLSPLGFEQARNMGKLVEGIHFDKIFTSAQVRSKETLESIQEGSSLSKDIPTEEAKELNERDYGDYTGKNKWEMQKLLGEEEFLKIRRGWDCNISNGESLKMVYERSVPFFLNKILPVLKEGKNVLVVCHGNSGRSIMKYIENISDADIEKVELPFGQVLIYDLDEDGHILQKEVRQLP